MHHPPSPSLQVHPAAERRTCWLCARGAGAGCGPRRHAAARRPWSEARAPAFEKRDNPCRIAITGLRCAAQDSPGARARSLYPATLAFACLTDTPPPRSHCGQIMNKFSNKPLSLSLPLSSPRPRAMRAPASTYCSTDTTRLCSLGELLSQANVASQKLPPRRVAVSQTQQPLPRCVYRVFFCKAPGSSPRALSRSGAPLRV